MCYDSDSKRFFQVPIHCCNSYVIGRTLMNIICKKKWNIWILCFFFISAWKKKCCIDRKLQAVIKIFFYLFVSSLSSSKTSLHTIYIHTEKKRKKRFDSIIWHNTIIIIQNDVRIYQIVIFIVIIFTKERLSCLKDRSN